MSTLFFSPFSFGRCFGLSTRTAGFPRKMRVFLFSLMECGFCGFRNFYTTVFLPEKLLSARKTRLKEAGKTIEIRG